MRRIPIRMKLAAALAVPLIGLFFITVVEVAETAADVDDVRAQTALARASVGPSGVITGIQNERTWAVVELIGQENAIQPPVVGYEESRAITDEAISAFRETLQSGSDAAAQAYAPSLENLDELGELRDMIDANTNPRDLANVEAANDVYQDYLVLIRPFLDANSRVALAIDDAELRQATSLVDTTTRQLEILSELARTSILEITIGGGLDSSTEIATIARLRSTFDAGNRRLVEAPAPFDAVVGPEYPSDLVDGFTGELDKALTGEPPDMASLLGTLNVPADGGYMGVRNALVDSLNEPRRRAERGRRAARAHLRGDGGPHPGGRHRADLGGVPVDHPPAAGAHPPGEGHGRPPAARRRDRHPRDPARREHHRPAGRPRADPHPRRGVRRRRRPQHRAGHRARPRRRAGRAPPQHRRQLRQPRPPQPEPPRPPARLHHRARVQRDQPRRALQPVPARPPRHPHAPQRRVAARAGRHRTTPPVGRPRPPHRRHPRRPRRGRELPARRGPRRRARHHHRLGRRRPRPPPRRARRERPRVLAARPERRHPRAQPRGRRVHAGGHRHRPRHGGQGRDGGQPAARGGRELHRGAVQVPGPLRGRQPRRPPRHQGPARHVARPGHHRHPHAAPDAAHDRPGDQRAGHPAARSPARPGAARPRARGRPPRGAGGRAVGCPAGPRPLAAAGGRAVGRGTRSWPQAPAAAAAAPWGEAPAIRPQAPAAQAPTFPPLPSTPIAMPPAAAPSAPQPPGPQLAPPARPGGSAGGLWPRQPNHAGGPRVVGGPRSVSADATGALPARRAGWPGEHPVRHGRRPRPRSTTRRCCRPWRATRRPRRRPPAPGAAARRTAGPAPPVPASGDRPAARRAAGRPR